MGEFWKEDKVGKKEEPPQQGSRTGPVRLAREGTDAKLGRVILMMGILGIFMPADRVEASKKKLAYEGIQGFLENMAMGNEESKPK
jgi:hypothetical protein